MIPFVGFGESTGSPRAWLLPVLPAILGFLYLALPQRSAGASDDSLGHPAVRLVDHLAVEA
jgi:hypothetical protein